MNNVKRVKQHTWKNTLGEKWMFWIPFCFLLLKACPPGTYKPEGSPGGISTCISCPDENHTSPPGSTSLEDCTCQEGYHAVGQTCEGKRFHPGTEYSQTAQCSAGTIFLCGFVLWRTCQIACKIFFVIPNQQKCQGASWLRNFKRLFSFKWPIALQLVTTWLWLFNYLVVHCPELKPPENGHFVQNVCNNYFNAACGIRCKAGFDLVGSSIRLCQSNGQWSGSEATCRGMCLKSTFFVVVSSYQWFSLLTTWSGMQIWSC